MNSAESARAPWPVCEFGLQECENHLGYQSTFLAWPWCKYADQMTPNDTTAWCKSGGSSEVEKDPSAQGLQGLTARLRLKRSQSCGNGLGEKREKEE